MYTVCVLFTNHRHAGYIKWCHLPDTHIHLLGNMNIIHKSWVFSDDVAQCLYSEIIKDSWRRFVFPGSNHVRQAPVSLSMWTQPTWCGCPLNSALCGFHVFFCCWLFIFTYYFYLSQDNKLLTFQSINTVLWFISLTLDYENHANKLHSVHTRCTRNSKKRNILFMWVHF